VTHLGQQQLQGDKGKISARASFICEAHERFNPAMGLSQSKD